jgi:uncharacterized membrane protein YeaQ/YmgE (transglycosylase-associated protein family)
MNVFNPEKGGLYMEFVWAIIIGFLAGAVAKLLMPGRDPGGFLITMLLGIGGALLATLIGRAVGWYGPGESTGFIGAIIGAFALLALYRLFFSGASGGAKGTTPHTKGY